MRRALSDAEIERLLAASADDDAACAGRIRVPQTSLWRALIATAARWGEFTRTTWLGLDVDELALVHGEPLIAGGPALPDPVHGPGGE